MHGWPSAAVVCPDLRREAGIGASTGGHVHGWSPEWSRGVHGIAVFVKQWHAGSLQFPVGRSCTRSSGSGTRPVPLVRQQNHSPDVMQPVGQPPPCSQVLHVKPRFSQICAGEKHGLHGPPPQPTQLGDRAEGDAGAREEEAGAERARSEELEELAARGAPGERTSRDAREVHQLLGDAGRDHLVARRARPSRRRTRAAPGTRAHVPSPSSAGARTGRRRATWPAPRCSRTRSRSACRAPRGRPFTFRLSR